MVAELVSALYSLERYTILKGRGFESGRYLFQLSLLVGLSDWSNDRLLIELNTLEQERACANELVCACAQTSIFGIRARIWLPRRACSHASVYAWAGQADEVYSEYTRWTTHPGCKGWMPNPPTGSWVQRSSFKSEEDHLKRKKRCQLCLLLYNAQSSLSMEIWYVTSNK